MNQRYRNTLTLTTAALVGAAYAVLTMVLAPISYGALQFRLSEALCILPFFIPSSAWGLFLGCAAANLLTGNVFDVVFGSLATLLAALCTAAVGRRRQDTPGQLLACLMRNPRRVFSAEELMERIWGWDSKAGIHVVWTNVTCLRRKLERLHAPVQIQTLRGAGYRLSPLP